MPLNGLKRGFRITWSSGWTGSSLMSTRGRVTGNGYSRHMGGHDGLYGPGDVTWRVNREMVLLAGGARALLMQVAHPLVAAGVAQHSGYREDP